MDLWYFRGQSGVRVEMHSKQLETHIRSSVGGWTRALNLCIISNKVIFKAGPLRRVAYALKSPGLRGWQDEGTSQGS